MMENWANIQGYEDNYEISSSGKIRRRERVATYKNGKVVKYKVKLLKLILDEDGYFKINLYKDDKMSTYRVNRLVAIHFIPNPLNLPQVNHLDGNKQNNNDWNLEWCDVYHNLDHSYKNNLKKTKLTKENVIEIKNMYKTGNFTQKEIGCIFNVNKEHINGIINNRKRIKV